ncbi:unnamed protein product, partial [Urochloa humidicola]
PLHWIQRGASRAASTSTTVAAGEHCVAKERWQIAGTVTAERVRCTGIAWEPPYAAGDMCTWGGWAPSILDGCVTARVLPC